MHENCSCVQCTVAFGLQLTNNLFPLWFEISTKAKNHLQKVFYGIQASTSALKQLQDLVDQDKLAAEGTYKIFTAAALEEIEVLGLKCDLLFRAIILLLLKASEREYKENLDGYWSGGRRYSKLNKQAEEELKADNEPDLLIGPIPDLTSLATLKRIADTKWSWLEARIKHCEEQLRWVSKGLQLQLRIARLAQLQQPSRSADREAGTFEAELLERCAIESLRHSRFQYVRSKARKQEKAQRLWDLKEKRKAEREEAEKDNASVNSGSSQASARTAVDDGIPAVKPIAEKQDDATSKVAPSPQPMATPHLPEPMKNLPMLVASHGGVNNSAQNGPTTEIPPLMNVDLALDKKEVKDTSGNIRQKLSETMSDLKHKIFGKDETFTKDYESQELEAWIVQCVPWSDPIKLPFGHRRLQHGLKKAYSKKDNNKGLTTFGQYMKQSSVLQSIIDEIAFETNRLEARRKLFLASDYHERDDGTSLMVVFFSIEEEKPPIKFTDCLYRTMTIPYEVCKNWNLMGYIIYTTFRDIPVIGAHVLESHFDLVKGNGEIISLPIWGMSLKPGSEIKMFLWPMENHPLERKRPWLPSAPPLPRTIGPPPAHHREMRETRIRGVASRAPLPKPPGSPSLLQRMFPGPQIITRRPPGPPGPPGLPPPLPPGIPHFRVMPRRVGPPSLASSSSASTVDEDVMTRAEEKQLSFVDYIQELERARGTMVADLLAKFTNMKDVVGSTVFEMDGGVLCERPYHSDSDSDTSTSSSIW